MSILFHAYPLARPALFAMDAETAHEVTLSGLQRAYECGATRAAARAAAGADHADGHAAGQSHRPGRGLDKNGAYIDALGNLGFGFIEVGTVTRARSPATQAAHVPPAARQCADQPVGLQQPGPGRLSRQRAAQPVAQTGGILGLNIGKNADTPIERAADDYLIGLAGVYPHADYVTVNISSPNTKNLRALQGGDELSALLAQLADKRKALEDQHQRRVPMAVKIAPDLTQEQIDAIADTLPRHGIDGVIATNTTLSRDAVAGMAHAEEAGGLSGAPVHELSLAVIRRLKEQLGSRMAIIGVGGVLSGKAAQEKMQAGADAVQLYTGLIYRGPALVGECVKAVAGAR